MFSGNKKTNEALDSLSASADVALAPKNKLSKIDLADIKLSENNYRLDHIQIGIDDLLLLLGGYAQTHAEEAPPTIEKLKEGTAEKEYNLVFKGSQKLEECYEGLIYLGNTFVEGEIEQPPKLYSAGRDGLYEASFAHRRIIASKINEIFGGPSSIDAVIIHQSKNDLPESERTFTRLVENSTQDKPETMSNVYGICKLLKQLKSEGKKLSGDDLSKRTGLKRRQAFRLLKIAKRGADKNMELLYRLNDANVSDLVALEKLYKYPALEWEAEAEKLLSLGVTAYRADQIEVTPTDKNTQAPEADAGVGVGDSTASQNLSGEEADSNQNKGEEDVTTPPSEPSGSSSVMDVGYARLIDILRSTEPSLLDGIEVDCPKTALKQIVKKLGGESV